MRLLHNNWYNNQHKNEMADDYTIDYRKCCLLNRLHKPRLHMLTSPGGRRVAYWVTK